jgi:Zn-dependent protease with chaperone function
MSIRADHLDIGKLQRTALLRTLLIPVLLLSFFLAAPTWYESHLHWIFRQQIEATASLSQSQKSRRLSNLDKLDIQAMCSTPPLGYEKFRSDLQKDGVCATFDRLWWGQIASVALLVLLIATILSIMSLNLDARRSSTDLIRNYRLGWKIAIGSALLKLGLLIPLMAYSTFEFTVLLFGAFFPKLLLLIVIGGLIGLWTSVNVLLRKVPMEVNEPMSREITPKDAPEMWNEVVKSAEAVGTAPPDRIVAGLKLNFFVTEIALRTDNALVTGRTLFVSVPLLKHFTKDEVIAVIGHELAHFKGNDTAITRVFVPLRVKVNGTIAGLARSGFAGRPSLGLLTYFTLSFERTVQQMARLRELAADRVGAELTSPEAMARVLIKLHVFIEALKRISADPSASKEQSLMESGWQTFIRDSLQSDDLFWAQLAQKELPHPLDTHPPLKDRLDALGAHIKIENARQIALESETDAYSSWFSNKESLFEGLSQQADKLMGKARVKAELSKADYGSAGGRELLDLHFPEKRWKKKQAPIWVFVAVFGVMCLICFGTFLLVPVLAARLVLGVLTLLLGWIVVAIWRARNDELVLNAHEIYYPTWKRPLPFSEVASVELCRINSTFALKFNLKEPRKPLAKWKLPITTKVTLLYLGGNMTAKPLVVAQTVHHYFNRVAETKLPPT